MSQRFTYEAVFSQSSAPFLIPRIVSTNLTLSGKPTWNKEDISQRKGLRALFSKVFRIRTQFRSPDPGEEYIGEIPLLGSPMAR